jgi:hypothetical protein
MLEKGQKLRLKRAMWGHKPGTVGKVTKVHPATPVNAYTAQMKFKGSPKMSVADKDLDDLLEPVPVAEARHRAGCECGFCKNMGRGFGKKQDKPAEPAAEPEKPDDAGKDAKMESWLPTPPAEDQAIAPPSLNAGQVKQALLHDEFQVAEAAPDWRNVGRRRNRCECSDPGCPVCQGKCTKSAVTNLRRVDMEDVTGTMFCHNCASDALASGVFREDIGAKIKYR